MLKRLLLIIIVVLISLSLPISASENTLKEDSLRINTKIIRDLGIKSSDYLVIRTYRRDFSSVYKNEVKTIDEILNECDPTSCRYYIMNGDDVVGCQKLQENNNGELTFVSCSTSPGSQAMTYNRDYMLSMNSIFLNIFPDIEIYSKYCFLYAIDKSDAIYCETNKGDFILLLGLAGEVHLLPLDVMHELVVKYNEKIAERNKNQQDLNDCDVNVYDVMDLSQYDVNSSTFGEGFVKPTLPEDVINEETDITEIVTYIHSTETLEVTNEKNGVVKIGLVSIISLIGIAIMCVVVILIHRKKRH